VYTGTNTIHIDNVHSVSLNMLVTLHTQSCFPNMDSYISYDPCYEYECDYHLYTSFLSQNLPIMSYACYANFMWIKWDIQQFKK